MRPLFVLSAACALLGCRGLPWTALAEHEQHASFTLTPGEGTPAWEVVVTPPADLDLSRDLLSLSIRIQLAVETPEWWPSDDEDAGRLRAGLFLSYDPETVLFQWLSLHQGERRFGTFFVDEPFRACAPLPAPCPWAAVLTVAHDVEGPTELSTTVVAQAEWRVDGPGEPPPDRPFEVTVSPAD
jgi:hypothetical protein